MVRDVRPHRAPPPRDDDYEVDEQKQTIAVLESGSTRSSRSSASTTCTTQVNTPLVHHLQNAICGPRSCTSATSTTSSTQGEVKIVDEFTGRVLEGRRYSEGLHQAIEAKENVRVKEENQTLATITIQNYFRMYEKLAGMTGTARTQARGVRGGLQARRRRDPHQPAMVREDEQDLVYKTEEAKWHAVIEDIAERHEKGQPVLVGTVSIEKSEKLSGYLNRRGIPHNVLNAKQHEREARSSRRPGGRRRSRWPPTWPAEASTSCSAGTPSTSPARRWRSASGTTTSTSCSRWIRRKTVRSGLFGVGAVGGGGALAHDEDLHVLKPLVLFDELAHLVSRVAGKTKVDAHQVRLLGFEGTNGRFGVACDDDLERERLQLPLHAQRMLRFSDYGHDKLQHVRAPRERAARTLPDCEAEV